MFVESEAGFIDLSADSEALRKDCMDVQTGATPSAQVRDPHTHVRHLISSLPIASYFFDKRTKLLLVQDNYINKLCERIPRTCADSAATNQYPHPRSPIWDPHYPLIECSSQIRLCGSAGRSVAKQSAHVRRCYFERHFSYLTRHSKKWVPKHMRTASSRPASAFGQSFPRATLSAYP